MKIWFASDLHFQHKNIIRLTQRPFSDINEMNETIIANFNSIVASDDMLYILGDVNFKGNADKLIPRLNGRKVLVQGNHDKDYDPSAFEEICMIKEIVVPVSGRNYRFVLCHYPFAEWNGFYKGAIHLHGHQHNKADYNEAQRAAGLLRYDVGVDANNFMPVSAEQIVRFFKLDS